MNIKERLETMSGGTRLNLARVEDRAAFSRVFGTLGRSAKECYQLKERGVQFITEHGVKEIVLPNVEESKLFVDILHHLREEDHTACSVKIVIPAGVEVSEKDIELAEQFKAISHVTCDLLKAQDALVVTDEVDNRPNLGTW